MLDDFYSVFFSKSLIDICQKVSRACHSKVGGGARRGSTVVAGDGGLAGSKEKPFDAMNNIVANLLLNLSSPSRFEGSLNVDLNEITMNLVPFPRLHYLVPAISPLFTSQDLGLPLHMLNQSFSDVFSRDYQLIKADPKHSLYLACALILRGKVNMSDIRRNIERLQPSLSFVHWNQQGWKTGHCSVPPIGQAYSVLNLANNTCFRHTLSDISERFNKLFRRKAHLHHYTTVDGMELDQLTQSMESLNSLVCEYESLETTMGVPTVHRPRFKLA
jgi:tubulin epsilon